VHGEQLISVQQPLFFFISWSLRNNAAYRAAVSMVWLFANSPYAEARADRANASEPHLRIPAEYQCRPCEQREAGDSGWRWATNDSCRLAAAVVDGTGRRSEKKGKERRAVRVDRARVVSSVSSWRSLTSPKRCTLALPSQSTLPALLRALPWNLL